MMSEPRNQPVNIVEAGAFQGVPAELAEALIESRWADALACTDRLVKETPRDARLLFIRGVLLRLAWRMDEAIESYRKSIELGYQGVGPYRELFQHLEKRGFIDEALACWQAAFDRGHSTARLHAMALDARLKRPDATNAELLRAHEQWAAQYGRRDPTIAPLQIEPYDGSRPLRVGYVCSFWEAPTIRFMLLPVLKRHDPQRVQTYLYVSGPLRSGETWRELYQPHVTAIREVDRLADREFVELTRSDRIDVLVELNGHSGAHRYSAMASRCAPVQAVYLNYTSTTGVENMDYVIGDRWSPPPGTEASFTERVERLAGCFFNFDYGDDPLLPPISLSPHLRNGRITFGCFGASSKINPALIGWWCEILRRVPDASFFIRNFELSPEDNRRALERQFVDRGIDPSRLRLIGKGTRHDVVRSYADVDIALDTYPYCGGNTTAEALWQGVPVVTLSGPRFSASYGASLLHGAGCSELIARSPEEYVDLAVSLAGATHRLAEYRSRLRSMVIEHGLGNADMFTPQFEDALIAMRSRAGVAESVAPTRVG
jgi:predicted O-linked N-acetylglucosamine transferase (SPINDLY family)